ncbi:hypothetical protein X801_02597 [Opisthorchis viverrini]|uniref:Uncharacterized protein n=2 Tax=Opisthorchis viverrini TaxID=6198 RepID=A0A1S8X498_OPIVI|nr:hypothetical protein T265_07081 [Opisthorchis viverrini]KER25457.1 hypothetical protein T265_07081 [Opisthorchis viverrini]OON21507.1 hypothetical protein X801_02597 [Opisthorchis viverrini]
MTLLIYLGNYRYCTAVNYGTRTTKISSIRWSKAHDWGLTKKQTTHLVDLISSYGYGHYTDSSQLSDSFHVAVSVGVRRLFGLPCWCQEKD